MAVENLEFRNRVAAEIGLDALNGALMGLGRPPVGLNPFVHMVPRTYGGAPIVVVEKARVAPFNFLFEPILNIEVGPCPEIFWEEAIPEERDHLEEVFSRVLTAEVVTRYSWWGVEVVLRKPGGGTVTRDKYLEPHQEKALDPYYAPYSY